MPETTSDRSRLRRREALAAAAAGALAVSPAARAVAATRRDPLASAARAAAAKTDPADLGVLEAAALLRAGKLSARELLAACQARIDAHNGGAPTFDGAPKAINAWVRLYPEQAARMARAADARLRRERGDAPLVCGIPIGLKDLYAVKGLGLTASSHVLDGNVAHTDSAVWNRLRAAGMVLVGHTHTHEFADGATTDQVGNPWALDRSPGGSSGGSGAALAAAMIPAATGTDTGGSLRIPAALCAVSSIKATHGRVPIDGIVPLSATLDHAGPMARSVADCAALLEVMAAPGGQISAQMPPPGAIGALATSRQRGARPLAGVTIGVTPRAEQAKLAPDVADGYERAQRALRRLGARIVSHAAPPSPGLAGSYTIFQADMWSYHRQFADRAERYRPAIRESVVAASAPIAAADYVLAQQGRDQLAARWDRWFREHGVDALLEPTVPITAPLRGHGYDPGAATDPATAPLVALTFEWDLTGMPVVALPAGIGSRTGLPVGVSLVARRGREAPLVRLAVTLQERELAPPKSPVAAG